MASLPGKPCHGSQLQNPMSQDKAGTGVWVQGIWEWGLWVPEEVSG